MQITGWALPVAGLTAGLTLGLGLSGCSGPTSAPPGGSPTGAGVPAASTPASPYAGPMYVKASTTDDAPVAARSGAAGRALECEGRPFAGGVGDFIRIDVAGDSAPGTRSLPDGGLERVSRTPAAAFERFLATGWPKVPTGGYTQERKARAASGTHRVLQSFDVAGRTRVAVILADGLTDYADRVGWGVESWAQCDPAEWPAAVTDTLGIQVWTDAAGRRVPTTVVNSYAGPEHCDWQLATFLTLYDPQHPGDGQRLGNPLGYYVRDVQGQFTDYARSPYAAAVPVPAEARDSGYRYRGRELWVSPSGSRTAGASQQSGAVYLVDAATPGTGERWPGLKRFVGCA